MKETEIAVVSQIRGSSPSFAPPPPLFFVAPPLFFFPKKIKKEGVVLDQKKRLLGSYQLEGSETDPTQILDGGCLITIGRKGEVWPHEF